MILLNNKVIDKIKSKNLILKINSLLLKEIFKNSVFLMNNQINTEI